MDVLERIESKELNIEVLTLICDGSYCQIDSEELTEELLQLAKLGKQMQWVSVKDRKPEHEEVVDIWVDDGDGFNYRVPDAEYNAETGMFESQYYLPEDSDTDFVTHWMPLPPSPKEAE